MKYKYIISFFLFVWFLLIIFSEYRMEYQLPSGRIVLEIKRGMSFNSTSDLLYEKCIIKSKPLFKLFGFLKRAHRRIKEGEYEFLSPMSYSTIFDKIINGKKKLHKLMVLPGSNMFTIANIINESGLAKKEDVLGKMRDTSFLKLHKIPSESVEGYLFPETYSFYKGVSVEDILSKMIDEFFKNFPFDLLNGSELSLPEAVILASIVEKESYNEDEKPLISAVFLNRLKLKMPLQADPTVIYGLLPDFDGNLRGKDLKTDTPFNTYLRKGLPPTPICNPSKSSIVAVLSPADVNFLYFVSKNDGTHIFSDNYRVHSRYVNIYQKSRGYSEEKK